MNEKIWKNCSKNRAKIDEKIVRKLWRNCEKSFLKNVEKIVQIS